jgi:hypothetical protein
MLHIHRGQHPAAGAVINVKHVTKVQQRLLRQLQHTAAAAAAAVAAAAAGVAAAAAAAGWSRQAV